MSKIFSIDIGGTKIAIGYVVNGNLKQSARIPTPNIKDVNAFTRFLLNQKPSWVQQCDAIGVSTTGFIKDEGITAINPNTLNFPQPFPLQKTIHQQSKRPTVMINDAQAAAWYEFNFLRNINNMAYITVSTGVGGGIIINGELIKGIAGHVGHTKISDQPNCGCGLTGCIEAIASGTAIQKRAQAEINRDITNVELFKQSATDRKARAIINDSARAIADLCTNLKLSLNLEIVVIGGGIGLASNYLDQVRTHIASKPDFAHIDVIAASSGNDSCLLGAAFLASYALEEK